VRISFCCVFELSTQELRHGEEGKEKESEEEEVILGLSVATSSATHEIGGWTMSGRLSHARSWPDWPAADGGAARPPAHRFVLLEPATSMA
jgi:hypothetical protein